MRPVARSLTKEVRDVAPRGGQGPVKGMRTSRAGLFCLVVFAPLAVMGTFTLWVLEPWNRVTEENFLKIAPFMPLNRVKEMLGEPTRIGRISPHTSPRERKASWDGGGYMISVWLSSNDEVVFRFFDPRDPPTFRMRLQRLLGLIGDPKED
jgi:hypothetical protein